MAFINLGQVLYPVGSIYQSFVDISPATLFGGTWAKITDRFLYCGNSTASGGSNNHSHEFSIEYSSYFSLLTGGQGDGGYDADTSLLNFGPKETFSLDSTSKPSRLVNNAAAGSNKTVTPVTVTKEITTTTNRDLPPYQGCFTWRRTA